MNQSTSSKPEAPKFPWDFIILMPTWVVFAYVSVAFPHKTFHILQFEVPMTPLLLFFASSLLLFADLMWWEREEFGDALSRSLLICFLIFLPVPVAWGLLYFYEVSTLPSFLAVFIIPVIDWAGTLRTWLKSRKTSASLAPSMLRIRGMPKFLRFIGFYMSGLFFGFGTMISMSYLFCTIMNQSFEVFAKANPAVILLGGATIMAGILALSRPSS